MADLTKFLSAVDQIEPPDVWDRVGSGPPHQPSPRRSMRVAAALVGIAMFGSVVVGALILRSERGRPTVEQPSHQPSSIHDPGYCILAEKEAASIAAMRADLDRFEEGSSAWKALRGAIDAVDRHRRLHASMCSRTGASNGSNGSKWAPTPSTVAGHLYGEDLAQAMGLKEFQLEEGRSYHNPCEGGWFLEMAVPSQDQFEGYCTPAEMSYEEVFLLKIRLQGREPTHWDRQIAAIRQQIEDIVEGKANDEEDVPAMWEQIGALMREACAMTGAYCPDP